MSVRSFLIRGGIAVVLLAALWFFTSRWCALFVDQFYTPRLATLQSTPLGWNGIWLQFGPGTPGVMGPAGWSGPGLLVGQIVDFNGPDPDDGQVAALNVDAGGQLVLLKDGSSFVLGSRAGTLPGGDEAIPAFAAVPGVATSVVLDHSLLSWPTPFETNFMTGHSPSWQRYLYYRLSWKKPSGAELDVVWRYRQGYDAANGWQGQGTKESIRIEIRPASR
jgi:hypothetical protein